LKVSRLYSTRIFPFHTYIYSCWVIFMILDWINICKSFKLFFFESYLKRKPYIICIFLFSRQILKLILN
jgi:hypothetical protein